MASDIELTERRLPVFASASSQPVRPRLSRPRRLFQRLYDVSYPMLRAPTDVKMGGKKEKVWNPPLVDGFARSAAFIVRDKDKASALFRRFDTTSMRNLLYLQARVASLNARQEAFDEEDFAALNPEPRKLGDHSDPKIRLLQLKRRLGRGDDDDLREDGTEIASPEQRIKDLALCLDYPLRPLTPFPNRPQAWPKNAAGRLQRPAVGALLEGDLSLRLEKIILIVAHRFGVAEEEFKRYLGTTTRNVENCITRLEFVLQDSLIADLDRRIVPNQLVDFNMSWEDMEMFGHPQIFNRRKIDWERKREEALNRGQEDPGDWPWNSISEHWREKFADRYGVAMDLKHALKEYREHSLTAHNCLLTKTPR